MAICTTPFRSAIPCIKAFQISHIAVQKRLPSRRQPQIVAAEGKQDQQEKKDVGPVSGDYKKRLRDEYVGLGGAPNKPMGSNYFLWIIVGISVMALIAYLTGSV